MVAAIGDTRVQVVAGHDDALAGRHVYGTAYLGWVLNRDEVVEVAGVAGFELVRERLLQPPMQIAGAPEDAAHVGLDLRRSAA